MIQDETLDLLEWSRLCEHVSTFAATKMGAIAARLLSIPQTQAESLSLLAQTQEIYTLEQTLTTEIPFGGIRDIRPIVKRATLKGVLSGDELLDVASTLAGMRRLRRFIEEQEDVPILLDLISVIRTYPELEQEINHCIDEQGKVADRASVKLGNLRRQLKTQRDRITQTLQNILQRKSHAIQENLITQRGDRFVLPVKANHKEIVPGIVHDSSTSGATLYIEPHAIVSLGNDLRQLHQQEKREEEAICRALTEKVAEVYEDLETLVKIATILDLATARARYSYWLQGNPPRFIAPEEPITLRELHHPLLVWQHRHEEGKAVVPVTACIRPTIRVVAITGPNTGGKTVTLKTIALAALMAKVGLFVPAREPVELPWFGRVLADIGDEQSLEQSLSTFSGHIRRICRILDRVAADSSALVLLDEVGAGTDPSEGTGLAIALLKHLAERAQLTIATTHFGELKALKYEDERFENASVEFDEVSLQPTYRLLWGIPGRSNALAIARRLGLSPEVIENAQEWVGTASEDVNQAIAGLEAERRRQETQVKETSSLLSETERLHEEVARKAQQLKEREQQLRQQQEIEIQKAIAEAKKEVARAIKTLQKGTLSGQEARQASQDLDRIAGQYLPSKVNPRKPKPGYQPKIGEKVRIPSLGQTGEVLHIEEEAAQLTVRFGLMKMTVGLAEIESLDGKKAEVPQKEPSKKTITGKDKTQPSLPKAKLPAIQTARNTLDIRGMRVVTAESELEQGIAKAYNANCSTVWIIHGKGTGKLREGVHHFLSNHPQVENFELGDRQNGGTGVTIAYLT
ncbi:endonuclease MutS2 [Roseofilum casamattae]|uniref:Endonuclease MutS2 n=1 Tax=Roseofilum casamattae BLCC-M143 TaxID=3022442 RepID=A0ABT7BWL3_9CYAN|nr:endonuclease MutS2 [Roseofilum casamattae BLCC-M143]